ncbi:hypothetical protein FJT64_011636 [Amphibalanus amphitrite]|uniref:Uncharacterized protein n=1 Tax=Amphibalanus amphitrite TaxID=1232801 RepID=A0A6A4VFT1_AMPAM|nr:hypothetical protein FJT64_011636 [Amphibalanus amphitrite]
MNPWEWHYTKAHGRTPSLSVLQLTQLQYRSSPAPLLPAPGYKSEVVPGAMPDGRAAAMNPAGGRYPQQPGAPHTMYGRGGPAGQSVRPPSPRRTDEERSKGHGREGSQGHGREGSRDTGSEL